MLLTFSVVISLFLLFNQLAMVQTDTNNCYFEDSNSTSGCELTNSCLSFKSCDVAFSGDVPNPGQSQHTHCFIYYHLSGPNNSPSTKGRGCFVYKGCEENICYEREPSNAIPYPQLYCCCKGDLCNTENLIERSKIVPSSTSEPPIDPHSPSGTGPTESDQGSYKNTLATAIIVLLPAIYLILFLLSVISIVIFCCWNALKGSRRKKFNSKVHKVLDHKEELGISRNTIELVEKIGNGRYAQVFKALHGDSHVAVKIFQSGHQEFENWTREKDLYQNPGLLEHENILKFLSAEIRPFNEYWLVTEYHPHGALMDFLKENTLNTTNSI